MAVNSQHGPSVRDVAGISVPLEGSFIQASSEEIQTLRRATCCGAGVRSSSLDGMRDCLLLNVNTNFKQF